jgi:hypothetical protein
MFANHLENGNAVRQASKQAAIQPKGGPAEERERKEKN